MLRDVGFRGLVWFGFGFFVLWGGSFLATLTAYGRLATYATAAAMLDP